jgi:hypothetical protein
MSFDRQLDILMAALAGMVTVMGCIFIGGLSMNLSLLISAGVFLAGLLFGRSIAEFVNNIF